MEPGLVALLVLGGAVVIGVALGKHLNARGKAKRDNPTPVPPAKGFWKQHENLATWGTILGGFVGIVLVSRFIDENPSFGTFLLVIAVGLAIYYRSERNKLEAQLHESMRKDFEHEQ